MRDLTALTARTILRIESPESLFSESTSQAKDEYRSLARKWHPDSSHFVDAHAVFAHIAHLYKLSAERLATGNWCEPVDKIENETEGVKRLRATDGRIHSIEYLTQRRFELGTMLIGNNYVAFEINRAYEDLFRSGFRNIERLRFADAAMAAEVGPSLPQIIESFRTSTSQVLIVRKTPDQILLSDALSHWKGKVPDAAHTGWILNCLFNIACYLNWSGIAHNAIGPETLFISPLRHSVQLLGGWFYAGQAWSRLTAIPERTLRFIPPDVLSNKRSDPRTDLELIKSVGRELLGDAEGFRISNELLMDTNPELSPLRPMIEWLLLPTSGDARDDYEKWKGEALTETFGYPNFVEMNLDTKMLYDNSR